MAESNFLHLLETAKAHCYIDQDEMVDKFIEQYNGHDDDLCTFSLDTLSELVKAIQVNRADYESTELALAIFINGLIIGSRFADLQQELELVS